jgi:carbonic anhydrase
MPEGNFLTIGNQTWKLLQYHFHSPSENALAGKLSSMELHLVHSNVDTGQTLRTAVSTPSLCVPID